MKLTHLSLLIPLFLAASPLARAENTAPSAPPSAPADGGQRAKEFLKKFDKDGDGKLSDEEKAAAKEAMKEKGGRPDKGGPGGPGGHPGGPITEEIIKKFDKDGDGKLNDEEKAAAREAFQAEIKKFDKDGDGKLNDEERVAAFLDRLEKHPEMKAKVLERFDENKDGQLSSDEVKKAVAAHRMGPDGGPGAGPGAGDKGNETGPRRVPKPKGKEAPKASN